MIPRLWTRSVSHAAWTRPVSLSPAERGSSWCPAIIRFAARVGQPVPHPTIVDGFVVEGENIGGSNCCCVDGFVIFWFN